MNCFKSFTTSFVACFILSFFPGGNLPVQTSLSQHDMPCVADSWYKQDPLPFTFIGLNTASSKKLQFNWRVLVSKHLLLYSKPHAPSSQDNNGWPWNWVNSLSFWLPYISWWNPCSHWKVEKFLAKMLPVCHLKLSHLYGKANIQNNLCPFDSSSATGICTRPTLFDIFYQLPSLCLIERGNSLFFCHVTIIWISIHHSFNFQQSWKHFYFLLPIDDWKKWLLQFPDPAKN